MKHLLKKAMGIFGITATLSMSGVAHANYPDKSVMITVSSVAGTTLDIFGRVLAEYASKKMNQPVVVENKPGASGMIGAQYVSRQNPDGYHLVLNLDTLYTVAPFVYKKMNISPSEDLLPISVVGSFHQVLLVNKSLNVSNYKEFIDKAKNEKLMYSSAGISTPGHLTMEMLKRDADIDVTHVPYRGNVPATMALYTSEVDTGFLALGSAIQYVQESSFIPLAISGAERDPRLPNIPTLREAGGEALKDFDVQYGFVLAAPKDTDAKVVDFWNNMIQDALKDPTVNQFFTSANIKPTAIPYKDSLAHLNKTANQWEKVVKELGISIN